MPWVPELFSAPVVQDVLDKRRRDTYVAVPYFDGFLAGEPDALVKSFAGEPRIYDPVRGRVKGEQAFKAFAAQVSDWLEARNVAVEEVEHVVLEHHGFGEVVVHVDTEDGRVALPFAAVSDRRADARLDEIRVYHSNRALTGRHATRLPLLQPDPGLRLPQIVADHQRAAETGDVDGLVAAFEPDGCLREPGGAERVHRGADALRAYYERLCSDGGIALEHCAIVGDGRSWALEYNIVEWGSQWVLPQAGLAVYVRGESGKLAAVRVYDDIAPPD
jgi:hypothetical protein